MATQQFERYLAQFRSLAPIASENSPELIDHLYAVQLSGLIIDVLAGLRNQKPNRVLKQIAQETNHITPATPYGDLLRAIEIGSSEFPNTFLSALDQAVTHKIVEIQTLHQPD